MKTPWQLQNRRRQQPFQNDITNISTVIQPNITLPVRRKLVVPVTPALFPTTNQQTAPITEPQGSVEAVLPLVQTALERKKKLQRTIALALTLLLGLAIYFTWHAMNATAAPPVVAQQNYNSTPTTATTGNATDPNAGKIVVYILGAITNPGIYSLPADARVYQLVQAAGGLLPKANTVALNMAAKLTDGEEIYVLSVGETAPPSINAPAGSNVGGSNTGQLVNINTASEAELRQALNVSATTAQKIVAYRAQHGPYTSVDQLLQVVSQSIYVHIKNLVTV